MVINMHNKSHKSAFIILTSIISIIVILTVILVIIVFKNIHISRYDKATADRYTKKMIIMLNRNESFEIKDIFDFNFDRGYVVSDSYNDGKTFNEVNDLNLNIESLESLSADYVKRIIFVDKEGNLIYDYQYYLDDLVPKNEGVIIYPTTKVQKCESTVVGAVGFEFLGVQESDYYSKSTQ